MISKHASVAAYFTHLVLSAGSASSRQGYPNFFSNSSIFTPMLRTLIIDDEPIIRADIEAMLAAHADINIVGVCGSIADAKVLIPATRPDLLLLDIHLSDGLSFSILEAMPGLKCNIIFITAYDEHALRAIRIGALDYLLKPLDEDELNSALGKVRGQTVQNNTEQIKVARAGLMQNNSAQTVALRSAQYIDIVRFEEILYCAGEGSYTTFHLSDGRSIMVAHPLKEYEDILPQKTFLRTHQSYIVNTAFAARYDRNGHLQMRDGAVIPVAARRRDAVLEVLTGRQS